MSEIKRLKNALGASADIDEEESEGRTPCILHVDVVRYDALSFYVLVA